MRLKQTGIFEGRVQVKYSYGRYGWTRGGGKTWHGGVDVVGLDDIYVRMPYYQNDDGTLRSIAATIRRARCITDRNDKTWEWGNYIGALFDANQTPDDVNYLVMAHNAKLLVKEGQHVKSGDILAVMGNTGNAAGCYKHVHLEARNTVTGRGVDPTRYSGTRNAVGVYSAADNSSTEQISDKPTGKTMQCLMIGPLDTRGMNKCDALAVKLRLISASRYYVLPVCTETYCVCVGAVSNGDAVSFYQLAEAEGWTKDNKYLARYVG